MDIKKLIASKTFVAMLIGMAIVIIALLIFQAGVALGHRKGLFACGWAEHYQRDFGTPAPGFVPKPGFSDPNGHGAFGDIVSLKLPTMVIRSAREPEKTVDISDDTVIMDGTRRAAATALHVGDHVVIIGQPDDNGQVDAKIIRILASGSSTVMDPSSTP